MREAEARLTQARKILQDATLRAPFDGVVISRLVERGATVFVGLKPQTILVIARDGERLARAQVTPDQASRLMLGQSVVAKVAQQSYHATIQSITGEGGATSGKHTWAAYAEFRGDMLPSVGSVAEIHVTPDLFSSTTPPARKIRKTRSGNAGPPKQSID